MMMMFVFGINVESDLESFTENKIFYILNNEAASRRVSVECVLNDSECCDPSLLFLRKLQVSKDL